MKNTENKTYSLGMIGLGTMGRNIMYNMADHGYSVAGLDKNQDQVSKLKEEGKGKTVQAFTEIQPFLGSLKKPRIIMMLVPAGNIVDSVISELVPLIDKGDLIIDAGNSHFTDTDRRDTELAKLGIHFFGMGVSGGAKGARFGPSMMPGGDKEAYKVVQPILEAISAKVNGDNCVTYIGPGASGHFVKMVHNGIEYALMQMIAEVYQILKKGLDLDNKSIHDIFKEWNEGKLQSYLMEITAKIFEFKKEGSSHLLLDDIKDEAKSKGTGKWTSQIAMDLQLPIPSIDTAVSMRDLSKYKSLRLNLNELYPKENLLSHVPKEDFLKTLGNAFYFAFIIAYAQGLHLLSKASEEYQYHLNLSNIAKIWRGGCIIRSQFLNEIYKAYERKPQLEHLLLDSKVRELIQKSLPSIRFLMSKLALSGIGSPALASTLSYFDLISSKKNPANLIQAQRDYFGAHTFELIGKEGVFHSEWGQDLNKE